MGDLRTDKLREILHDLEKLHATGSDAYKEIKAELLKRAKHSFVIQQRLAGARRRGYVFGL